MPFLKTWPQCTFCSDYLWFCAKCFRKQYRPVDLAVSAVYIYISDVLLVESILLFFRDQILEMFDHAYGSYMVSKGVRFLWLVFVRHRSDFSHVTLSRYCGLRISCRMMIFFFSTLSLRSRNMHTRLMSWCRWAAEGEFGGWSRIVATSMTLWESGFRFLSYQLPVKLHEH